MSAFTIAMFIETLPIILASAVPFALFGFVCANGKF